MDFHNISLFHTREQSGHEQQLLVWFGFNLLRQWPMSKIVNSNVMVPY